MIFTIERRKFRHKRLLVRQLEKLKYKYIESFFISNLTFKIYQLRIPQMSIRVSNEYFLSFGNLMIFIFKDYRHFFNFLFRFLVDC